MRLVHKQKRSDVEVENACVVFRVAGELIADLHVRLVNVGTGRLTERREQSAAGVVGGEVAEVEEEIVQVSLGERVAPPAVEEEPAPSEEGAKRIECVSLEVDVAIILCL